MPKGERVTNGKHYLMNGRFSDREQARKAAEVRKADGYLVKVIDLACWITRYTNSRTMPEDYGKTGHCPMIGI